jgi:hypothetical protein
VLEALQAGIAGQIAAAHASTIHNVPSMVRLARLRISPCQASQREPRGSAFSVDPLPVGAKHSQASRISDIESSNAHRRRRRIPGRTG